MSADGNKELIRRYVQAIDDNQTSDWSILDDFIAEDFERTILRFPASAWTVRE